ncbi:MAG: hypothetical protein OXD30_09895 [Bryobacterales bacterium]|nr:hypothetical protein [Bryobacterales bacterium]
MTNTPIRSRHGVAWYELDLTYWQMRLLAKLGSARVVYAPNLAELDGQQQKSATSGLKAAA